nr:MAG TPA: hypothetical protein [Caudoviricetes sp.]
MTLVVFSTLPVPEKGYGWECQRLLIYTASLLAGSPWIYSVKPYKL